MSIINTSSCENSIIKHKSKRRLSKPNKSDSELIQLFWEAPKEAFFNQSVVAPVTGRTSKTLECDRWKKSGIPFRKIGGKVLYQKCDVIRWLEGHKLVASTSEYQQEVCHD